MNVQEAIEIFIYFGGFFNGLVLGWIIWRRPFLKYDAAMREKGEDK